MTKFLLTSVKLLSSLGTWRTPDWGSDGKG
jgi:hypothetical protein